MYQIGLQHLWEPEHGKDRVHGKENKAVQGAEEPESLSLNIAGVVVHWAWACAVGGEYAHDA